MIVQLSNTNPNPLSKQIWWGAYYDEDTQCITNDNSKTLITLSKECRQYLETNNIPLTSPINCKISRDVFTVGRKKGKHYYRIVEIITNEILAPKDTIGVLNIGNISMACVVQCTLNNIVYKDCVSNYSDIKNFIDRIMSHVVTQHYSNINDVINQLSRFEERIVEQLEKYNYDRKEQQNTGLRTNRRGQGRPDNSEG